MQALVAIKNLLQLRMPEPLVFKDFCGLDGALERTRRQLQNYAMDVESLRSEVELIFHRKMGKVLTTTYFVDIIC